MIIFHEGLPGSGKSYEAVVNQIIVALKNKRQVFAYIEGLNYEKFSEITGISIEQLKGERIEHVSADSIDIEYKGLLHQIIKEQVPSIYDYVANDSLVVIDELQDFFPVGTRKLTDGITEFVTQHRHRGIDIVVMGQDNRDCHNLWKRRIDQLIHFLKRDAIGFSNHYTWTSYKSAQGKFIKLRSGKGKYDQKYFGLYASHSSGVENLDTYTDDRTNIFKSKAFTFYLPIFLVLLVFSIYFLFSVFSRDSEMVNSHPEFKPIKSKVLKKTSLVPESSPPFIAPASTKKPAKKEKTRQEMINYNYSQENYLIYLLDKYRPRLLGYIQNKRKLLAQIEFLDDSFHVHERLNLTQIYDLGWTAQKVSYGIKLTRNDDHIVVTSWPIDSLGKVSNYKTEAL
jgi:zona occludens toxin